MSGRQFCLENPIVFSSLRMKYLFSCVGTMGGLLFGEDICSCGNATGKPVVFGQASRTGGHAFPFAWEHSKFLLKEGSTKLPSDDQSTEKGWHPF